MGLIRNFLHRIESAYRGGVAGIKRFFGAIVTGLREFVQAPGATTAKWIRAIVDALFQFLNWLVRLGPRLVVSAWNWLKNVTIGSIVRLLVRTAVVAAVVIAIVVFALIHYPNSQIPEYEPPDRTVYLGQGWGPTRESADRQTYYYTPQGTGWSLRNMRYAWLVNLELPWGKRKFVDPDRMRAYGFLVDPAPTDANPHQLPVGFAKFYDPELNDYAVDITCAACHTGGLLARQPDGTLVAIRVDGGQGMHAFTAMAPGHFGPVLLGSMASTYLNPFKFNRFARNVLGEEHYKDGKRALRAEFKQTLMALLETGAIEKHKKLAPTVEGFGRTDAIARIANMVFGAHLDDANYQVGNAPVSYPPTWDIWKFDWVQYTGSVAQPMARNLGESLGVGATFSLKDPFGRPLRKEKRYWTSTSIEDLHEIELALRRLRPPEWPEDLLGEIDRDKAVEGGLHFARTCQGCHGPHPASELQTAIEMPLKLAANNSELEKNAPHWRMKLLSIYDIGTDPTAAINFVRNTYDLTKTGLSSDEIHSILRYENDQARDRKLRRDFGDALFDRCSPADRSDAIGACVEFDVAKKRCDDAIETAIDAVDLSKVSVGQGLNYLGLLMREQKYAAAGYTKEQREELNGFAALDLPQVLLEYKARPLSGIWATPPYLHNGSVHNIYQLLSPVNERDKRFFIGRREYDPVTLGYIVEPLSKGGFWFDVDETGNANTGHEFRAGYKAWAEGDPPQYGVIGPEFTTSERRQIIEYLKVHHDDPPHSAVYAAVLSRMVSRLTAAMPADAAAIADVWPGDEACNIHEYLGNHVISNDDSDLQRQIRFLRGRLAASCTERQASQRRKDAKYFSCRAPATEVASL